VILRSSAAKSLYPLIQSWPIPSDSAETLLVQQDGDDVVFLNDLRFRPDAALSFRIPLARSDLPGVHAALGEQWVFKGKDYRGVEVLAVLLSVPGSPWSMVAKVDSFEVLAEVRYRGMVIAVFVVLFILLTLVLAAFFFRWRQAGLYRKLYAVQQEEYKAEKKVRESEERYRQLFERAPFGIGIAALDGKVLSTNKAMERITGFSLEEFKGTNLADLYMNPDDRAELLRILETSESVVDYPAMLKRKDGTRYQASLTLGIVDLAGQRVLQTLIQDITERKRNEEALIESREQLRALAGRLEVVREDERTRISREVHDELGQALAVLKMDLDWVARRLPEVDVAGHDRTASMLHLVDDTIARVRRISTALRPGMLDDLGLLPSLEWQAREFADRTGLECKLDLGGEDLVLEPGLVTTLFRVSQELLANVARHAGATWFRLGMHYDPDQLTLIVSDNGQGITPDQVSDPKSLGLLEMRERVGAWGGDVTFHGVAGKGTEITVRVPLGDQVLKTSDQRQLEFPIP
jgi:PAS domain S-box-containing protein